MIRHACPMIGSLAADRNYSSGGVGSAKWRTISLSVGRPNGCKRLLNSGAPLSEIAGMLVQTEAAPTDRNELGSPASINKITWQKAGRVTEPGRYMFAFGWLIVTVDDLTIWRQFPNTTFTLVRTANEADEEYRLGTFELRECPQEYQ